MKLVVHDCSCLMLRGLAHLVASAICTPINAVKLYPKPAIAAQKWREGLSRRQQAAVHRLGQSCLAGREQVSAINQSLKTFCGAFRGCSSQQPNWRWMACRATAQLWYVRSVKLAICRQGLDSMNGCPQVVKVGTSSLVRAEHNSLNLSNLASICETVRTLRSEGASQTEDELGGFTFLLAAIAGQFACLLWLAILTGASSFCGSCTSKAANCICRL